MECYFLLVEATIDNFMRMAGLGCFMSCVALSDAPCALFTDAATHVRAQKALVTNDIIMTHLPQDQNGERTDITSVDRPSFYQT